MPDSLELKITAAAVTAIKGLSLIGISASSIIEAEIPIDEDKLLPALPGVICAMFDAEQIDGGTNLSDDIGYPLLIGVVDAANRDQSTNRDRRRLWRNRLIDHFVHNRLSITHTGAFLFDQRIEPRAAVDVGAWFKNLWVSSFVVRVMVRKKRRAA